MSDVLAHDRLLGPAAPALGWVPAPRYLLRRQRVLTQLRGMPPGEVLEIGPGAGMLLQELALRGHRCHALETSEQAQALIRRLSGCTGSPIGLHAAPQPDWSGRFPLLLAFEVLEHIEEDVAELRRWTQWLAPGGTLLMSVPAHQHRWNARDVWAGHVRRYEREQLADVVARAGLGVENIECYGFPLANVLEVVGERRYRHHERTRDAGTGGREDNTANSGIDRNADAKWYPLLRSWPGKLALRAAMLAQAPFLATEAGNGYLLRARKPR
jgi:SAM-dependent methyltransferase